MPSVKVNQIDLVYQIQGKGPPLMLVAGLASDSQSWHPILEDLSRQYQVITLDNRGVGRTTPQDIETSIQKIADDCIALIRHLELSSVHLLGHSMGGFVALDCAIRYPERVSKLILAGTGPFASERNQALFRDWVSYQESGMAPEQWFRNLFYWIFSKRFFQDSKAVDEALRFAIDYPHPQSKRAFKNQVKALNEFNCQSGLSGIQAKTLIICGKEDLLFPPEESIQALQEIPDSTLSLIENAAHSMHMEQPRAFAEQVLKFLENS